MVIPIASLARALIAQRKRKRKRNPTLYQVCPGPGSANAYGVLIAAPVVLLLLLFVFFIGLLLFFLFIGLILLSSLSICCLLCLLLSDLPNPEPLGEHAPIILIVLPQTLEKK
uniref:Uncharacterized protein n=1 Tax=Arundo donax TaxID=35708 RepID=A0A0A9D5I9_ARUDO